jgi:hypothetical protein
MAHIQRPFDEEHPTQLILIERRTEDDLQDHVKGTVLWKADLSDREPGYYIYDVQYNTYTPVEFIKNHWYWLYEHQGFTFVSLNDLIERYTYGTGYWVVQDPQHSEYPLYIKEQTRNTERLGLQIVLQEGYKAGPSGAPALTVDTGVPTLSEDPTLSTFVALALAIATAVSSPAFTQSHYPSDQGESESSETQNSNSTTDKLSPEQPGQEEPVLEAQLAHRLDVQDREPDNPLTSEQPAYQGVMSCSVFGNSLDRGLTRKI